MAEMNPETQGYSNAETGSDRASWIGNLIKRKKENERERTLHPKELWENEDLLRQRDYERQKDLMIQKGLVDTTGYKDKGVIDVQTQAASDNVGLDTTNRFLELGGFRKQDLPPSQLPGNDQPIPRNDQPNQPGAVATPEDAAAIGQGTNPIDILKNRETIQELGMNPPRGTKVNFKRDTNLAAYGDQPGTPPTTPGGGGGEEDPPVGGNVPYGPENPFENEKVKHVGGRSGTHGNIVIRDANMSKKQRAEALKGWSDALAARKAEAAEAGVEWDDEYEKEAKHDYLSSMFPFEGRQVKAMSDAQIEKHKDWVHPADIPNRLYTYPDPNEKAEVGTVAADGGINVGAKGSRKQPRGKSGNTPGQQFEQSGGAEGSSGQ